MYRLARLRCAALGRSTPLRDFAPTANAGANAAVVEDRHAEDSVLDRIGRYLRSVATYRKYGLFYQDTWSVTPDVEYALKHLPKEELELRNARIHRAQDLYLKKQYLPEEHWTSAEEERDYLNPLLAEAAEKREAAGKWH